MVGTDIEVGMVTDAGAADVEVCVGDGSITTFCSH